MHILYYTHTDTRTHLQAHTTAGSGRVHRRGRLAPGLPLKYIIYIIIIVVETKNARPVHTRVRLAKTPSMNESGGGDRMCRVRVCKGCGALTY